ncbi:MAG: hypothetical protein V4543_14395 [Bacteroidota bacterium]
MKNLQGLFRPLLRLRLLPVFIFIVLCACNARKSPDQLTANEEKKPLLYKDTLDSDKKVEKKKKIAKKTFWGIKTRKAFTRVKARKVTTTELFFVLKKPAAPTIYVQNIYWFHTKKRKIMVGPVPEKEKKYAAILHGPYKKIIGKTIVEEGQFYVGSKHGRWELYLPGDENILADKSKYYKGFPKESEISYYDVERTLIKEVKPVQEGRYNGDYFFFSPEGVLLVTGKYERNIKIGVWKEFYNTKKRKTKKTIQYPENAYAEQTEPYTLIEYDEKGFVTYDKAEEDKKKLKKK